MLTVVGADGWPLAVRSRGAERTPDGFTVDLPAGATAASGRALGFMRKGKALRERIAAEAARRGQPAPRVRM